MGDDQANDYIYKFVSTGHLRGEGDIVNNRNLLDSGTLYVARFDAGATTGDMMGTGEWLPLTTANPALAAYASQAEILVNTRLAADTAGGHQDGPAGMGDRASRDQRGLCDPDQQLGPHRHRRRQSRAPSNVYGQIIRWRETGGDAAALTLRVGPVRAGRQPDHRPGQCAEQRVDQRDRGQHLQQPGRAGLSTRRAASGSRPTALTATPATTPTRATTRCCAADPTTKEIRRFFVGPKECEVTGLTFTPDSKTMFINIQHPGEGGNSHWPEGGSARPRSATLIITKDDGGVIGS